MKYSVVVLCLALLAACGDSESGTPATSSKTISTPRTFRVEGAAMLPALQDGDVVEVLDYGSGSPERGDLVVFQAPTLTEREFVKRIIGLPGETVEIDESTGAVRVSGQALSERYVQGTTSCSQTCIWTVPPTDSPEARTLCGSDRCFFVLGDNRQNSSDSRQGWLVPAENILGYVVAD